MLIAKMAWRNVWRNHRRSVITIAAMTLALFVELIYSGLVAGLVIGMEEDATAFEIGDVQIFRRGYLTKPSLYDVVDGEERIVQALQARGYRAAPRLFGGGLAASGEMSSGVQFVGIDPIADAATLDLHLAIAEGAWLDDADPKGIVIGRSLARTLDAELGSEVVVLSQGTDGSMANDLFEVRGILMSVAAGLDRTALLMTEDTFRALMVLDAGAHRILVRKPIDQDLAGALEDIQAVVGSGDDAPTVKSWKQINPFLAQYIDSVAGVIVIVYFIVYVAVGILILNAMLMAVFERIREFGVLKAIGYGPAQVLSMMVLEGLIQATVATLLGVLLAAPVMWYLTVEGVNVGVLGGLDMAGLTMPAIWKGHYTLEGIQVPIGMLFFIVLCAVLWPAAKAAWISPVQAMHHS